MGLIGLIIALAVAIALAPIILGVIGTMLGLLFTALLYLFAGCPHHEPRKLTPQEQAEQDAPYRQLLEWDRQDAERAAERAADKAQRAGKAAARRTRETIDAALLDAQRRVRPPEDHGHAEP